MEKNIATQNSHRLASLAVIFCELNGIPVNNEVSEALANAIIAACHQWYIDNGRGDEFNPSTELICDDAIKYAFKRMQVIAALAALSANMGADMES